MSENACIKGFVGRTQPNNKEIKEEFAPFVIKFLHGDTNALFEAL